jgi:hypothetical protein
MCSSGPLHIGVAICSIFKERRAVSITRGSALLGQSTGQFNDALRVQFILAGFRNPLKELPTKLARGMTVLRGEWRLKTRRIVAFQNGIITLAGWQLATAVDATFFAVMPCVNFPD